MGLDPATAGPIDMIRSGAAEAALVAPDSPEFGKGTDAPRITNVNPAAPVMTTARIVESIYAVQPTVSADEWQRFRMAVGCLLGFVRDRPELVDDSE